MAIFSQNQVQRFWSWFASISDDLGSNLENHEILQALDRWILAFGELAWEVGPGIGAPNALAISPNGQQKLLSMTHEIVCAAPKCDGWEFHSAKPPKNWNLRFVLEDDEARPVEIDANEWQYALLRFPDGTCDIVVQANNLPYDEDLRHRAADIAVEGELGERAMLQFVQSLEVVVEFTPALHKTGWFSSRGGA